MTTIRGSTQIRHLPYRIFRELTMLLDIPGTRNWKKLISVLPDGMYSLNEIKTFELQAACGRSAASELLTDLGQQLMTVNELVSYLELINHQEALLLIKPHEPVRILQQPSSTSVQENNALILSCKASGFPRPQYIWIRDGRELENAIRDTLKIDPVSLDDSGQYQCKITNQMGSEYTQRVTVQVVPSPIPQGNRFMENQQPLNAPIANGQNQGIRILRQPEAAVIYEGQQFTLSCDVEGADDLLFQWYKNGYVIPTATQPYIHFERFCQGDDGSYSCRISGSSGDVLTQLATLQLQSRELRSFASAKTALLIGIEAYEFSRISEKRLVHPADDVYTLERLLSNIGFKVISLVNVSLEEMENGINGFFEILKASPGSYGLFYFGGHGFEINGKTYLVPCDAPKNWSPDFAVCAEHLLANMQQTGTKLDILLLDVCRVSLDPDSYSVSKSFDPPFLPGAQSIFAYATCPQSQAFEKISDDNGIYVKHLANFIRNDEKIQDVIGKTNTAVRNETERHPVTEAMHPTLWHSITKHYSLLDPVVPNPLLEKDATLMWFQYHRLPANLNLSFDDNIQVEVRFFHHFSNVCFLVLYVCNLGQSDHCDAIVYKPPDGLQVLESAINEKRSIAPTYFLSRGCPFDDKQITEVPAEFERWTRLDGLQRMPNSISITIQVEYVICGQVKTAHKNVVFNKEDFGIVGLFAKS